MNKIETIKNEMEKMIVDNNLKVGLVKAILKRSEKDLDTLNQWNGRWEKVPTTFAELRELMNQVTYSTVESAFNTTTLNKDEVRELWTEMDHDNQANFTFRAWQTILGLDARNLKSVWNGHLAKNYETLFDNEDMLDEFKNIVDTIKVHYN